MPGYQSAICWLSSLTNSHCKQVFIEVNSQNVRGGSSHARITVQVHHGSDGVPATVMRCHALATCAAVPAHHGSDSNHHRRACRCHRLCHLCCFAGASAHEDVHHNQWGSISCHGHHAGASCSSWPTRASHNFISIDPTMLKFQGATGRRSRYLLQSLQITTDRRRSCSTNFHP
jgi:hypothetical protein